MKDLKTIVEKMDAYERSVYLALAYIDKDEKGYFEASIKQIKEAAKISECKVLQSLKSLKAKGFISKTKSVFSNNNLYDLTGTGVLETASFENCDLFMALKDCAYWVYYESKKGKERWGEVECIDEYSAFLKFSERIYNK